jgi:small subunit ribosomal protein S4
MSRYRGPSCKKCRRNQAKLFLKGDKCETAKCPMTKRPNVLPGAKSGKMTRKLSEYGVRLREKQKLRFFYGVTEKQMRKYFKLASDSKNVTGNEILTIFERRLDNLVFRLNLADSRKQARQLVRHSHFLVNGRKVNIPSFLAKEGDEITIKEKSLKLIEPKIKDLKAKGIPTWLGFDEKKKSAKVLHFPEREEIDVPVQEQLIVEFYSR